MCVVKQTNKQNNVNSIIFLKEETSFISEGKKMQNNLAGEIAAQHIDQKKQHELPCLFSFYQKERKVV